MQTLALAEEDVQMPAELCENSEFAEKLKDRVQDFKEFELVMRDEVERKSAPRRNNADQKTKDTTEFSVGGVMSY